MKDNQQAVIKAAQYSKKRNRKKVWYRVLTVLSAFVVFVTTYILILPAITLSDEPICGITEHKHSENCIVADVSVVFSCPALVHSHDADCFDENGERICGKADFFVHTHSESCFDADGELICPLSEIKLNSSVEDSFSENATDAPVEEEIVLEITTMNSAEEKTEAPLTETQTEKQNQENATSEELNIAEKESEVSEENTTVKASVEESVSETKTSQDEQSKDEKTGIVTESVETTSVNTAAIQYSASQTEKSDEVQDVSQQVVLHTHSASCYDENEKLICGLDEVIEHIHSSECITTETVERMVCTFEEHIHDEVLCYSDNNADTETADDWEKTLPEKLTNDYAYDLVLVALSQVGYSESGRNIKTDAEGNYSHYTRYGARVDDAYCEWQEEFVSFCLHYAGISEEIVPYANDTAQWKQLLAEKDLYADKNSYEPKKGDLVFLSSQGELHSIGIVAEISSDGSEYEIIEGNTANGKVEVVTYSASSDEIYGFCVIPEKKFLCESSAHIHTDACYGENGSISCGNDEHCHNDECLGLYPLSDEEKKQVEYVKKLIDEMPTADEIDEKLLEFEDADDMEGYQDYYVKTGQQGKTAYVAYTSLNEKQKAYIDNIDKLMESSWLWSAVTLAATAAPRADDVQSVSGDGIKVQLFNYSNHINKTADHTAWRPIASYFTFRNSSTTAGDPPSETTIVPSWNINSDHDIDGYTKTHATVERVLTENGTPVLDLTRNADGSARVDPGVSREVRDLSYLFSDTGDPDVSVYNPTNTFLQKDGNYYWYDSAKNAVDYDISANAIRLRNYVERNSTTAGYTTKYGDFTPFNYTNGEQIGLNADGVTPYHIESADVDYWFGMSMEVNFFQTKDGIIDGEEMKFSFSGDDDVWVFVDGVLVLDLGGTHGTVDGSINFATGQVLQYLSWSGANSTAELQTGGSTTSFPTTIRACFDAAGKTPNGGWNADGTTFADYSEHTLKIFYMERGSAVANCKLSFSLPALPDKSLTVTKDLVTDESSQVTDYIKDSLSYKFRVMKADSNGESTGELFVKVGSVYDILENGNKVGSGTVDSDGTFSIKAGQSAQFTEMLLKGGGHINYVVEELLPDNSVGQYSGVEYDVSGAGGETVTDDSAVNSFTAYRTGVLSAEQTQAVTYRNKVDVTKLSFIELSKEIADNAVFEADKVFSMQVKLGDILLPVGTKYTVGTDEREVVTEGIIPLLANETAVLRDGILSGTEYSVKELNTVEDNMLAVYNASVELEGTVVVSANGVSGVIDPETVVKIKVINQNNDFSIDIPISKQVIDSDRAYTFNIDAVEVDPNTFDELTDVPGTTVSVTGSTVENGLISLGYSAGTSGTKYYKIYEPHIDDRFIYDDTFYIVEVNTTGSAAELISIKKNGTEEMALDSTLGFVNRKTVKLNVTKEVVEKLSDKTFDFSVTVTLDGTPFDVAPPGDGAGYTVDGNVISFTLMHNKAITIPYIPHGAEITVSEITTNGYIVYFTVEGVHNELQLGDSVTLDVNSSDLTVHFTNDAVYELPETGSTGTFMYTLGGTALIVAASCFLLYKVIKRRKEDFASS